ncbi:MAG: hypothetical protein GY765_08705 [bacterium]|nr:hypothetical protein [bacterium]
MGQPNNEKDAGKGPLYGNTWNHGNIENLTLTAVTFKNGTFVAVGDYAVIYTSEDGKSWKNTNKKHKKNDDLFGVTYGEGDTFVAVGIDGLIMRSTDKGASWETVQERGKSVQIPDLYSVACGNGMYVAIDETGAVQVNADRGAKGKWEHLTPRSGNRRLTFGNGMFMATHSNGNIYKSTDGKDWQSVEVGQQIIAVHYDTITSTWLVGGDKIFSSDKGEEWSELVDLTKYGIKNMVYGFTSAESTFVAVGDTGMVLNSVDGKVWRMGDTGFKNNQQGTAFGKDTVVAVGESDQRRTAFFYASHYSLKGGTPPPPLGK